MEEKTAGSEQAAWRNKGENRIALDVCTLPPCCAKPPDPKPYSLFLFSFFLAAKPQKSPPLFLPQSGGLKKKKSPKFIIQGAFAFVELPKDGQLLSICKKNQNNILSW